TLASILLGDAADAPAPPSLIDRIESAAAHLDKEAARESGEVIPEEEELPDELKSVLRDFAARLQELRSPVEKVIVLRALKTRGEAGWVEGRDLAYEDFLEGAGAAPHEPEPMAAEDALFVMFTSGSTGK